MCNKRDDEIETPIILGLLNAALLIVIIAVSMLVIVKLWS
jgi:hypothetical protein